MGAIAPPGASKVKVKKKKMSLKKPKAGATRKRWGRKGQGVSKENMKKKKTESKLAFLTPDTPLLDLIEVSYHSNQIHLKQNFDVT